MSKKTDHFKQFFFPEDISAINKKAFLAALKNAVEDAGSLEALGNRIGFKKGNLSEVLNEKREPSESLLKQLGVKKVITFEPLGR